MTLVPLGQVAAQLQGAAALPFSVRDAHGGLLLARGNLVTDEAMRQALLARAAFVDMDEVHAGQRDNELPVGERRLKLWRGLMTRLHLTLQAPAAQGLETSVRGIAVELAMLVQADPDMAQALLAHPDLCAELPYSVAHSARVAATWALLALRQDGAEPAALEIPLAAALTMNLGMLHLQDRLTHQEGPLKPAQRDQIHQHPKQSAAMLRAAGVTEPLWLAMVEQHHDAGTSTSTSTSVAATLPEARRLHMIDIYCACFGARAQRPALLPDAAVRRLYLRHAKDPIALALAHEFGLYPPGTVVRLVSLELALVLRRGTAMNAPIAIALQTANGEALLTPIRRDTSQPGHTVVAAVNPSLLRVRIPWAQLFTLF